MIASPLANTMLAGHLETGSILVPKGTRHKTTIVADLLLTALIDAFSILVIFLLMSFSSSGELLAVSKGQELPKASFASELQRNALLKLEDGKIFLEDKEIAQADLVAALVAFRQEWAELHPGEEFQGALTVQADRRIKFDNISQVIQASSHAGFSDIKFAVIAR